MGAYLGKYLSKGSDSLTRHFMDQLDKPLRIHGQTRNWLPDYLKPQKPAFKWKLWWFGKPKQHTWMDRVRWVEAGLTCGCDDITYGEVERMRTFWDWALSFDGDLDQIPKGAQRFAKQTSKIQGRRNNQKYRERQASERTLHQRYSLWDE